MQTGLKESEYRGKIFKLMGIVVFILLFSLCIKGYEIGFVSPLKVVTALKTWVQFSVGELFQMPFTRDKTAVLGDMPYYVEVVQRVKITLVTFLAGMLLAIAGSIFQMVFRNPMAAPTMLGVSTGVNIGIVALVVQFGYMAEEMMDLKYLYCYIGAVAVLGMVLILGKISSGKRKTSTFDLVLVGAILSQMIGGILSYYTLTMDNDLAVIYQRISSVLVVDTTNLAIGIMVIMTVICLMPMYLMRFSFNAVSFESDDTRSLGINSYAMKFATLILGTVMVTIAMIHCGAVGLISLVVPFISRALFGAEFRGQFWGDILIGGALITLCRDISGLIPYCDTGLPIGTVVDFVALPLFVLIITSKRSMWNEN